jgi:hypothetical protein
LGWFGFFFARKKERNETAAVAKAEKYIFN